MKITIVKHRKCEPIEMAYPKVNPLFTNIAHPATNKASNQTEQRLHIFMHRLVYEAIWQHANANQTIELGGALLGLYAQHNEKKFIVITNVLNQPETYFADPTFVKFTNQFYTDLEFYVQQINRHFPQVVRLGLYHTHPNYGVYLSKTDATAFKRVTAESFQVAFIIDPVKQDDGFFLWLTDNPTGITDLSDKSAYSLYDATDPMLCPFNAATANYHLAACNPFLTFAGIATEAAENLQLPDEVLSQQTEIPTPDAKPVTENKEKITLSYHQIERNKPLELICPLYNITYENRALNLKQYFRTLKNIHQHKFPYMVFLPDDFLQLFNTPLQQSKHQIALLYGKFAHDPTKKTDFLLINHVQPVKTDNLPNADAINILQQHLKEALNQRPQTDMLLGWVLITADKTVLPYEFYDLHKHLLPYNYQLGMLLQTEPNKLPEVQNSILVAYDHDLKEPYNYYGNVYVYRFK